MSIKHKIRDGKGGTKEVRLTSRSAIKAFCYECVCWNYYEVEKCTSPLCPLFPFRNIGATKGTRPVSQKSLDALQIARRKAVESTISAMPI